MNALTTEEKRALRHLIVGLEPLLLQRSTMPLRLLLIHLRVALAEGKTVNEYAHETASHQANMSRHLHELGDPRSSKHKGLGFVEHKANLSDIRQTNVYLTAKGRKFARDLAQQILSQTN